jgi:hypothetical protein
VPRDANINGLLVSFGEWTVNQSSDDNDLGNYNITVFIFHQSCTNDSDHLKINERQSINLFYYFIFHHHPIIITSI